MDGERRTGGGSARLQSGRLHWLLPGFRPALMLDLVGLRRVDCGVVGVGAPLLRVALLNGNYGGWLGKVISLDGRSS